MKIVFAGSGAFGLPSLLALRGSGHSVEQVVTQPDRPAGRGRRLSPTPIGKAAADLNLPLLKTANINLEELAPADLMVVIAFGQKIASKTIDLFPLQAVNLHASLLPKYRGAAPVNAAILAGDAVTGNSIIRLAERMDAGKMLGQSQMPIDALETAGELHDRLAEDGAPLLLKVIESLAEGRAVETAQDETAATKASKLSRESAIIDWSKTASSIACQIRGLYPWPGCQVDLVDSDKTVARLTLVRALAIAGKGEPGRINSEGMVGTGAGLLKIVEVKPLGGRSMSLEAFKNGRAWGAGSFLRAMSNAE